MAKCVTMNDGEYLGKAIRVPDLMAKELVAKGRAEYVGKEAWKKGGERITIKEHSRV